MRGTSTPNNSISGTAGLGALMIRDKAVPNITSSAKLTCPFSKKKATSSPAVRTEGRTGKRGFLQVSIFWCNTS